MSDGAIALAWIAVLLGGAGVCVLARRAGMPSTNVRDLLHVGAGVWPLGWSFWHEPRAAIALAAAGASATLLVPLLSRRAASFARFRESISGGDERWAGVALYAISFAVLTAAGLRGRPFPAAAALLALALGDGIGGAVGRRFGRTAFRLPGAKPKTLEGSATVAALSALGVLVAALRFGAPIAAGPIAGAAALAAAVEAISPRGTDNVAVPAAVWLFLGGVT